MNWRQRWLALGLAALILAAIPLTAADATPQPVTLQLKWEHAFQFAGYYAAEEMGYYREAGLEVRIEEAGPTTDVVEAVLSGAAQYGVGTSSLLLARAAGKPVVALAVIFQHSPLALAVLGKEAARQSIHDLNGKVIALAPQSEELLAYLRQEKVTPGAVTDLPRGFDPNGLREGRIGAVSIYTTNELFTLRREGIPYHLYTPRSSGIDFYGDNLFTSEQEIAAHPDRAAAFRAASLRGWVYALANPETVIDWIETRYPSRHPRAFYEFEARQMVPLIRDDIIEVGYMNPGRWRHIAETFADLGLLPRDAVFDEFLYDPEKADGPNFDKAKPYLYGAFGLTMLLGVTALLVLRANRILSASMKRLNQASRALSESEARFRALSDTTPAGIFMTDGTRLMMANPALSTITGYSRSELDSLGLAGILHPDDRDMVMERAAARMKGRNAPVRYPCAVITKGGEVRKVELTTGRVVVNDAPALIATMYDISDLRRAEEDLRRSEERHRLLADHASDVIWTMDLDGRFTYVSPSIEKLTGFGVDEVMTRTLEQAVAPESMSIVGTGLNLAQATIQSGLPIRPFRDELELRCRDGSTVWAEVTVSGMHNEDGNFIGLVGVGRDITKRRQTEERVRHMAQHDALTDLPNRALFADRLEQGLAAARRGGHRLAVIFVDLDHFKPINDEFGHDVGDLVLKAAAGRIRDCVRASDTVARIGGDEFVLLLPHVEDAWSAGIVAEKVRAVLAQPFHFVGHDLTISGSIGIAVFPDHGDSGLELSKNADIAMYVAKREGRGRFRVFQSDWAIAVPA